MILTFIEFEILRELRDGDRRRFYISDEDFADAVYLLCSWDLLRLNPDKANPIPFYLTDQGHRMLHEVETTWSRYH